MDDNRSRGVEELLSSTSLVLLDFDGPLVRLMPPPVNADAAAIVREALGTSVTLPEALQTSTDHLALLRWASTQSPAHIHDAELGAIKAELAAAQSCTVTPGAIGFLTYCQTRKLPIVIVSNNNQEAIQQALKRHTIDSLINDIIGRPTFQPHLMKPNTHMVDLALQKYQTPAARTTFIGDSVSDIEVAQHSGTKSIGLAKSHQRAKQLHHAGATLTIHSMTELTPHNT